MSSRHETSAALVAAIRQGNTDAENALLEKYYRKILFILNRKTRDMEMAKDLCQDTFRIVLERLRNDSLEEPDKLAAFLHSTAVNLYIAEIRKLDRRQTYPDTEAVLNTGDSRQGHYDRLLREKSSHAIRELIRTLDNERDRAILYSYYIEEKDKPEICQELDLTQRHFDKVIYRARQRFKELLLRSGNHYLAEVTT